ncbi:MAG: SpoIIE family protein phosphatase [Bacteroidetes bacterium]|nr:SpoIIE family protein phosphatase [Bacteroidota bacterium]HET6245943.1 SpoIIE family protein phosphatase [Bacteroidia bacterium]
MDFKAKIITGLLLLFSFLYLGCSDHEHQSGDKKMHEHQHAFDDHTFSDIFVGAEQETIVCYKKTHRNSFYFTMFLLFTIAGVSFNQYRIKKKSAIELTKSNKIIEEKNRDILASIHYAKYLQEAILPPNKLVKEYLQESFIMYKPKDIVAGDFYWVEKCDKNIYFAAADCTGHGVPGAMVSVVCSNALNRTMKEYGLTDPGKILDKVREIVISTFERSEREVKDGMDISLCALQGNKLHWAGANNPLWISRNNAIIEIKADKQPIGKYAVNKMFTTHSIELQKNDSLYIFTDGFADQFGGEHGKKFKSANFKKLLLSIQNKSMQEQNEILNSTFEKWKGILEQVDDVCVIGVKV